jgi:hypothetical protein
MGAFLLDGSRRSGTGVTRRQLLRACAASPLLAVPAADEWIPLFDGTSLHGWKASENAGSWKVVDGCLAGDGPRSHLFYTGSARGADFKNFELEAEVRTEPLCNSGIYFHTRFQESGFPQKGFEIQVNNTALGEGTYRERKKTASLYGVRNVYKAFAKDGEWFRLHALVRGKNVQIRLNDMLLVDYTEPTPPVTPEGSERGRFLDHGTFALQCHDPGSKVRYRSVRVRPLPDDATAPGAEAPVVDDLFRDIINLSAQNYPVVDYHVHLKTGLTIEDALKESRRLGIGYGIAINCGKGMGAETDEPARKFVEGLKPYPVFIAMQAEGREWVEMFSRGVAGMFDYIFTDSMTWTDNHGRRMRTWIPAEVARSATRRSSWTRWSAAPSASSITSRSTFTSTPLSSRTRSPRTTTSCGPRSG